VNVARNRSMLNFRTAVCLLLAAAFSLALLLVPDLCRADGASELYFNAESCYAQLKKDTAKMRMRHHWMRCINGFERAYRKDSRGPWAPASLYMTAVLYRDLSHYSGSSADRNLAGERFRQVIDRFPNSRYRGKASQALQELEVAARKPPKPKSSKPESRSPAASGAQSPKKKYLAADACYRKLQQSVSRQKYRHNWLKCIRQYEDVHRLDPEGPWAAAGLYKSGRLYWELYRWSKLDDDAAAARSAYDTIIADYHQSRYRARAQREIELHTELHRQIKPAAPPDKIAEITRTPKEEHRAAAPNTAQPSPTVPGGRPVTVENLRYWSNPSYTRVVIDATRETAYTHRLLKKDPSLGKPQRLYVDLKHSRLGERIQRTIPINDDLLIDARAGQFNTESVRVVVDIKSFETYKIFSLKDPFRIVIDVWGGEARQATRSPEQAEPGQGVKKRLPSGALARQLALGVSRIVIDPGHGGKDYGAPGYLKGVHEKRVVLQLARRLAKRLRSELNCEILLTRSGDRYLTLEERTAYANTKNADLFISLHTNAHRDRRAHGIETYFLNLATDDESIRVAAMENATSQKNISDLQTILNDLMQNAKINESSRLAGYVQTSIIGHLKKAGYKRIKNKGVKQAPFYVLLGARMPAILIETSFISNPTECKRLVSAKFQERFSEAVTAGVKKYIEATQSTALYRHPAGRYPGKSELTARQKSNS